MSQAQPANPPRALIVGDGPVRLWGMTSAERLRRSLRRAGVSDVAQADAGAAQPSDGTAVVVLRGDWVFDEAIVRALIARPGVALRAGGRTVAAHLPDGHGADPVGALEEEAAAGLEAVAPDALVPAYDSALRRKSDPLLEPLTAESRTALERRTFGASYKGVTDLVTKYVWPAPARAVTRWLAGLGATPNQVTLFGLGLVVLAYWLFQRGDFLAGLAAAWLMTFLDTVDGKLARVTLTSTKFGGAFDHAIDLIHPPFWWWAWIVGLAAAGMALPNAALIAWIVIGGYVAMRLQEGLFLALFKIEIHTWRRFDSWFRLITSRRNPNLLLLSAGALAGRPDLDMIVVAVWTAASFAIHTVRILQAVLARTRGPVVPWMAS